MKKINWHKIPPAKRIAWLEKQLADIAQVKATVEGWEQLTIRWLEKAKQSSKK